MGSEDGSARWSVFDGVKRFPSTPETLMTEINTAIAALECTQFSTHLAPAPSSMRIKKSFQSVYDVDIAEEAYKLGCVALSEGKVEEGLHSLNISLSKCPPDEIDALAKIQSLVSFTVQQFQRSSM